MKAKNDFFKENPSLKTVSSEENEGNDNNDRSKNGDTESDKGEDVFVDYDDAPQSQAWTTSFEEYKSDEDE